MRLRAIAALLLAACGGEDPRAVPELPGAARYAELCAARGLPQEPPASPRQHLHAVGTVEFVDVGQGTTQRAELWLGGPSQMRFKFSAENGTRNVFLLAAEGAGWVSRAQAPAQWNDYPSPEVARETLLRWELLRFPWGWRAIVAAGAADARSWTRRAAEGEIVIEVGEDSLPRAVSYAGVELQLTDWRPADDVAWRIAREWHWFGPSGRRAERYTELAAQWLLFDDWFRPPAPGGGPDRSYRAVGAAESFGVVRATFWRTDSAPAQPDPTGRQWWLREGARVAGVLLEADAPPPLTLEGEAPPEAEPHRQWLRWTLVSDADGARHAAEEIEELARAAGLQVLGAAWMSEPDRSVNSVTILLPVEARDG